MILHLTDSTDIASRLKSALELRAEGARLVGVDHELRVLPRRLTSSAAVTGQAVATCDPDLVVIVTPLIEDRSAPVSVIYRVALADEAWIPDVTFSHDEPGLSVSTQAIPGSATISVAAASAVAAALALLPPSRVLAMAAGPDNLDAVPETVVKLSQALSAVAERTRRGHEGDETVNQSVRLGGEIAERLSLTAKQRARFLRSVRSAAIRGGVVPGPLEREASTGVTSKAEAKRRLAELERRLNEWKRAEI